MYRSTKEGESSVDPIESRLGDILSVVRKTSTKMDSYDKKMDSIEQRLMKLEEAQIASSSDCFSEPQKRKVPAHVRVSVNRVMTD